MRLNTYVQDGENITMSKLKEQLILCWRWIFSEEYEITVYRQQGLQGNMYKSVYTAKKLLIQKEKHLKFRDWDTKKMVEIRSSSGLDYKIEEK